MAKRDADQQEAEQPTGLVEDGTVGQAPEPVEVPEQTPHAPFKGGAFAVSLPAEAPTELHLLGAIKVTPGGPPHVIHLPAGDGGEHQLLDLQRHFTVVAATPKAATPDPRMTATK